jgi:hypothetical protein
LITGNDKLVAKLRLGQNRRQDYQMSVVVHILATWKDLEFRASPGKQHVQYPGFNSIAMGGRVVRTQVYKRRDSH